MMKICYISTGFPLSFQGGITNYVRSIAEDQFKRGNEVSVICGPDDSHFDYEILQYKSKIIPRRIQALKDKKALEFIKDYLERKQFDIIHIHMALDIDWDLYEVLKPYKYIVSLHDYFFLCPRIKMVMHNNELCSKYNESKCSKCISFFNTNRILNGIEYRLGKYLRIDNFRLPEIPQKMTSIRYQKIKRLLENAQWLLPVSKRVQEIYQDSGINGKYKIMYIGNLSADNYSDDFEFDLEKEKIDVAMIGAVSYLKGADEYIKFAEALSGYGFSFHFYGRAFDYSSKFEKVGIVDHGPYKQADLKQILANTDLGCVLSVWEDNGPQVVMEFLNNHIPVIGTRMGGIPDFVNENNGFLYNPYNAKEFNEVIERLKQLKREDILRLKKNTHRTTTSYEHGIALNELYMNMINI